MIKLVRYLILAFPLSVQALVPVEGILMGEAQTDIQNDPLSALFKDTYDKSQMGENKKIKLYQMSYESGQNLNESCTYLGQPTYSTVWQESQAKRSTAATLQYVGLDTSIKAIGAYAKKLNIEEEDFKRLTKNLVTNYCSKNITIFSLRNIESSLKYYYDNPFNEMIPSIESSPFATEAVKNATEKNSSREREFDLVLKNFRAFCSWGGETEDYRMMTPYLSNRYIMSFVIKNMVGLQDKLDEKSLKVLPTPSDSTVQVTCTDLICRKDTLVNFKAKFPPSVGSTGLFTDLSKLYCHHFRFQDEPKNTIPQVKTWLKAQELEDPIFETSQFISLMTGVPDFIGGVESYRDIPLLVRSSIDERWNHWAKDVLTTFSRDLLYEESLKVKVEPNRDRLSLRTKGFKVDMTVTLGEMDRLMRVKDKLDLTFDLKISKNYFRYMRNKWDHLSKEVDLEGQKKLKEEVAAYVNVQLKEKEKLFSQKMWNQQFSKLVADELLEQALIYKGPMFDTYKDEVFRVPVRFSYGIFALSYLRYRADVAAGRLKLNL